MQKSANGYELALFIAAIYELLVNVRGGGEAGSNGDVHCIVHDRVNNFKRFLGNGGAE